MSVRFVPGPSTSRRQDDTPGVKQNIHLHRWYLAIRFNVTPLKSKPNVSSNQKVALTVMAVGAKTKCMGKYQIRASLSALKFHTPYVTPIIPAKAIAVLTLQLEGRVHQPPR